MAYIAKIITPRTTTYYRGEDPFTVTPVLAYAQEYETKAEAWQDVDSLGFLAEVISSADAR